ncbi:MAG: penicillin-binding protein activator [Deltaproteobacteria bacterium]|nr:penicillin-binding protein activator [Deltaproteobacteria bacterium]
MHTRLNIAALLICLVLTVCPTAGHAQDAPKTAPLTDGDIVAIFEALDARPGSAAALAALMRYIDTKPDPGHVDEALLRLGRIRADEKDLDAAASALQRLLTGYPASPVKFEALLDLANVRHTQGSDADARSLLEAVVMSDANIRLRARSSLLLKTMDASGPGPAQALASASLAGLTPSIGALLPLKGSYARYGADALKGILLAANTFGQTGSPIEVFTADVEQSGASAKAAVEEMAANPRVAGLVGPLISASALEAALAAQDKRLPIITLSQREGLLGAGDFIYRNFLTTQVQAAFLAEYACKAMGRKAFVIIYPQNNYGIELAKHFSAEVLRQGCTVAAEASYPPGTTDFSQALRQAFDVKVKETKAGRRVIKEYTAQVQADALYMPDSYEAAALLAPYLNYYNITGVQLLGSNAWNSPGLVEAADKRLDGAVFVDGFFADSERPETKAFTTRFREVYGAQPGLIEAYSYDAAKIIIAMMTAPGTGVDRDALNARLRALKNFKGATGDLSLDANGEVKRRLFILTLKNGVITETDAAQRDTDAKKTLVK